MEVSRRTAMAGLAALTMAGCKRALSDGPYPSRAIHIMVPFNPGGPTDLVGRMVATRMEEYWKQTVVVENRPGASGSIGSELMLQRDADGYTLCLGNNASHASYEVLHPKLAPYHTLRDFAPVALIGFSQTIMVVSTALSVKTLGEFIAYAKQHPGDVNYGSPAFGSAPHLGCELLSHSAGIEMTLVNYSGASPTMLALAAGEIQVYMGGASSVQPLIKAGKVRPIAVMSEVHSLDLPDVPTAAEAGYPDVVWDSWYGILASSKVPTKILAEQNAVINKVMDGQDIERRLQTFGLRRKLISRDAFAKVIARDIALTQKVAATANIAIG